MLMSSAVIAAMSPTNGDLRGSGFSQSPTFIPVRWLETIDPRLIVTPLNTAESRVRWLGGEVDA